MDPESATGNGSVPLHRRKVLVTLHRRENQGDPMRCLARAAAQLAQRGDIEIILPVHQNPAVAEALVPELCRVDGVQLTGPLDYADFVATLSASDLVLTDSGGVQEEAAVLEKPVLALRRTTERPVAIERGAAELVGTDARQVYDRGRGPAHRTKVSTLKRAARFVRPRRCRGANRQAAHS
ncbi:UDP-N-acetylglucosamine 2-epimerase [Geodermatophilus poikilotrophus]|uniref:UDP-N-acetylglucosamine 2-epimerase n=1 Tax=Geodermatophilus poikilotrophus TaxID=1333667 RepID=UPI003CCC0106